MFVAVNADLFQPQLAKEAFLCDGRFIDLDTDVFNIVNLARFWFGLFSHRRGGLWKGMLQVMLPVNQDDAEASLMVGEP